MNAFPVCVDAKDADHLFECARAVAPTFGGINLEDIAAPVCFEVERRLTEAVDIPVFHDDHWRLPRGGDMDAIYHLASMDSVHMADSGIHSVVFNMGNLRHGLFFHGIRTVR